MEEWSFDKFANDYADSYVEDAMEDNMYNNTPVGEIFICVTCVTGKSPNNFGTTSSLLMNSYIEQVHDACCVPVIPCLNEEKGVVYQEINSNIAKVVIGFKYEDLCNYKILSEYISNLNKLIDNKYIYLRLSLFYLDNNNEIKVLNDQFATVYQSINANLLFEALKNTTSPQWVKRWQVESFMKELRSPNLSLPGESLDEEPNLTIIPSDELEEGLEAYLNDITTEESYLLPHQLTTSASEYGGLSSFAFPEDSEYSYLLRGMSFMKKYVPVKLKEEEEMPTYKKHFCEVKEKDWGYLPSKDSCMLGCYTHEEDADGKLKPVIYLCSSLIEDMAGHVGVSVEIAYAKVLVHEFAHALMDVSNQIDIVNGELQLNVDQSMVGRCYYRIEEIAMEESLANAFTLMWFEFNDSKSLMNVMDIVRSQAPIYRFGLYQYASHPDWSIWREVKRNGTPSGLRAWFDGHFKDGKILDEIDKACR